jgi:hypothetical protein
MPQFKAADHAGKVVALLSQCEDTRVFVPVPSLSPTP